MTATTRKPLNLALQGGGAHGAFTWGVLDYLLEDGRVAIEGVSGTSAGAMNAVILTQGFAAGGAAGARELLDRFWAEIGANSWMSPVHRSLIDRFQGNWNTDRSPSFLLFETFANMVSPYQFNPANLNPLRKILGGMVDFEQVRQGSIKLFISATNVRTGRSRVFSKAALSLDAIMASACLPNLFQAVEIDGDPYWDGGYTGNPSLWPLIYNCTSRDLAVIQINPLTRPGVPKSPQEIFNRVNEVTFNASLIAEMRAIAFVQRLIDDDHLKGPSVNRLKKVHVHMIGDEAHMLALGVSSKYNTEMDFLLHLKSLGRAQAEKWLSLHWGKVGHESTVDIRETFLAREED